ncbi:MAG: carbohydrate ABC transporter permease, partial [Christensenellales bacterium]
LLALAGLIGGVLTKRAAADRDHNSPLWFLAGFVCLPAALPIAALLKPRPRKAGITPGRISPLVGNRAFSRIEPWLYLAPFLAGLIVFTLYPVVNVIFLSFKADYSYLTRSFAGWGMQNYEQVIADKYFAQALRNTLVYALCVVPVSTAIAVVIAYLLNQKLKGSGIFQTAYFMPMVTSITAVGLAWKLMFNKNFGIINYLLSFFGVDPIAWLDSPDWRVGLMTLVIFGIWNILPFTIILLISGLQNIDGQYYTAARIDGAKGARIFFRITVPLLAPTIFLVSIINTISSFKVFSELYPLFKGSPGPYNNLYTVVYYIRYAMMENREYGVAAAAAIILFLFIFVFTMVQLCVQRRMRRRTG